MSRQPALCGTDGGYYRHRRVTQTPPCPACKTAHTAAEVARQGRTSRIDGIAARHGRIEDGLDQRAAQVALLREMGVIAA